MAQIAAQPAVPAPPVQEAHLERLRTLARLEEERRVRVDAAIRSLLSATART